MKYIKLNVSFLHGPELSCEYSLVFLLPKLGNSDRIAGQNLPNIKIFLIIFDQPFIAQLILPNMKKKTVKIIQLLGNKFPARFNKYCW